MQVRVVGVAYLFPGQERTNGSCGNFDAFPSGRSAVPGDFTHLMCSRDNFDAYSYM